MTGPPWDQRLARIFVRPLSATPITPNQLTVLTLLMAWAGAGLFATGDPVHADWGAGLFVLARFLDHLDGELARLKGMTSKLGYYLDYASGGLGHGALYVGIGIGLAGGDLGPWALVLGATGGASSMLAMGINLAIDAERGHGDEGDAVGYPGFLGFELEDGMYLLAPLTWFGFLVPFFVLAALGAAVYLLWSVYSLLRARREANRPVSPSE